MPLYFFDTAGAMTHRDDVGADCADREATRMMALKSIAAIAAEEVARGGDQQDYTILAHDENRRPFYTATVSISGRMIDRKPDRSG